LTPEEKIEYKALEAIMEKIVRPNGLDGDLCDKVGKDFFEIMDKMHKILDRGERRYRKEKLAQKLDTNIATMKATGSSSDQGDDSSSDVVEGVMMTDMALVAGLEVPTSMPISMLPGNRMGDHCCWICGDADHLSYQCPDNCCWICGDRDHWSNRCPRHVKPYNSLVEAMIDLKFKNLHGEDLVRAYLDDIAAVEQRVDTVSEKGCRILQERLTLLRRKAEVLAKWLQQPAPTRFMSSWRTR
jgi:hypothetical protein